MSDDRKPSEESLADIEGLRPELADDGSPDDGSSAPTIGEGITWRSVVGGPILVPTATSSTARPTTSPTRFPTRTPTTARPTPSPTMSRR